jgi:cobalamin biosynthesis protein CobT
MAAAIDAAIAQVDSVIACLPFVCAQNRNSFSKLANSAPALILAARMSGLRNSVSEISENRTARQAESHASNDKSEIYLEDVALQCKTTGKRRPADSPEVVG